MINDCASIDICTLLSAHFMEFFTAVLSRNPIHDIGDSLVKVKSITKVRVCLR